MGMTYSMNGRNVKCIQNFSQDTQREGIIWKNRGSLEDSVKMACTFTFHIHFEDPSCNPMTVEYETCQKKKSCSFIHSFIYIP